ncbi:MAG: 4-hydroxy-tetrahydrodipicolinate reductase [Rickettsiales bacterium]
MSSSPVRLGIVGCAGRMGRAIVCAAEKEPRVRIVGGVALPSHAAQTLSDMSGVKNSALNVYPHTDVKTLLSEREIDVLIDFSLPDNVPDTLEAAAQRKTAVVVGVTGLSPEQRDAMRDAAQAIPLLYSATMSKGVNMLLAMTKKIAALTGESFDVEITEMHHRHKIDAPSGVAIALGKAAAEGRSVEFSKKAKFAREGRVGARPAGEIGFSVLRGGSVFGDHTVLFAGENEHIALSHSARNRDVFADGAVLAALSLFGKPAGMYSMADVLDLGL